MTAFTIATIKDLTNDLLKKMAKHDKVVVGLVGGGVIENNKYIDAYAHLSDSSFFQAFADKIDGPKVYYKLCKTEINVGNVIEIKREHDKRIDDVDFIIKTFHRYDALKVLLDSIYYYYPTATITVLDDSEIIDDKFYDNYRGVKLIKTKFDIGLSEGRNRLIKATKKKYVLLLDDDFEFTIATDISKFIDIIESDRKIGVVGGMCTEQGQEIHYEHNVVLGKDKILRLLPDKNKWQKIKGIKCRKTGCVLNFGLFRRELFKDILWDKDLKVAEHSIHGDEPVIVKRNNSIDIIPIKELMSPTRLNGIVKSRKEPYIDRNVMIWTEKGFIKIKNVIAHKCNEKMVNLRTNNSCIDVTEHHSLVVNGKKIKPSDIGLGGKIQTLVYPKLKNKVQVDKDYAWMLGFFLGDGSYTYNKSDRIQFTNQKIDFLNKAKKGLEKIGADSFIINSDKNRKDRCYFLDVKFPKIFSGIFKEFYTKDRLKKIPRFVFNFDKESRIEFFNGFLAADGGKTENNINFSQKSAVCVQGLLYLISDVYKYKNVYKDENKFGKWYSINVYKNKQKTFKQVDVVKNLQFYNYNGLVYDVEVDDSIHTFSAGVGNVNVHNTAFYYKFPHKKWSIIYTPQVIVVHHRKRDNANYVKYRMRSKYFMNLFVNKYGFKDYLDVKGRSFRNLY